MSTKELWQWLDDDQTNFAPSSRYCSPLPCAESVRPDMRRMFRSGQLSRAPLISQFAVAAVHMAMEQAGIDTNKEAAVDSFGMVYGASNGQGAATQKVYDDFIERGASGVKPRVFQESVFNAPASLCAIHYRATSKRRIGVAGGASVLFDVALAVEVLRRGRVPAPLAKTTNQSKNINTIYV